MFNIFKKTKEVDIKTKEADIKTNRINSISEEILCKFCKKTDLTMSNNITITSGRLYGKVYGKIHTIRVNVKYNILDELNAELADVISDKLSGEYKSFFKNRSCAVKFLQDDLIYDDCLYKVSVSNSDFTVILNVSLQTMLNELIINMDIVYNESTYETFDIDLRNK
jgi:hypothetical protein